MTTDLCMAACHRGSSKPTWIGRHHVSGGLGLAKSFFVGPRFWNRPRCGDGYMAWINDIEGRRARIRCQFISDNFSELPSLHTRPQPGLVGEFNRS
jgi:hypothetical protein